MPYRAQERQPMRGIEADGYITRGEDLTPRKRICLTCKNYHYDSSKRRYVCTQGHKVGEADWRFKYDICDEWEKE